MHTALITGGSAGLGLALTRDLAADGWHVIVDAPGPGPAAAGSRTPWTARSPRSPGT